VCWDWFLPVLDRNCQENDQKLKIKKMGRQKSQKKLFFKNLIFWHFLYIF
jgi:hypothetical protein